MCNHIYCPPDADALKKSGQTEAADAEMSIGPGLVQNQYFLYPTFSNENVQCLCVRTSMPSSYSHSHFVNADVLFQSECSNPKMR